MWICWLLLLPLVLFKGRAGDGRFGTFWSIYPSNVYTWSWLWLTVYFVWVIIVIKWKMSWCFPPFLCFLGASFSTYLTTFGWWWRVLFVCSYRRCTFLGNVYLVFGNFNGFTYSYPIFCRDKNMEYLACLRFI